MFAFWPFTEKAVNLYFPNYPNSNLLYIKKKKKTLIYIGISIPPFEFWLKWFGIYRNYVLNKIPYNTYEENN